MTISAYFDRFKKISIRAGEALDAIAEPVSYPKGYLLHKEGTVCRSIYLMLSGIARTCYYRDGQDITNQFFVEGEAFAAMESLYSKRPSFYAIELLEDSKLLRIDYSQIEHL